MFTLPPLDLPATFNPQSYNTQTQPIIGVQIQNNTAVACTVYSGGTVEDFLQPAGSYLIQYPLPTLNTPLINVTPTSNTTGTINVTVYQKGDTLPNVVIGSAPTTVNLASGATVDLASGATVDLASGSSVNINNASIEVTQGTPINLQTTSYTGIPPGFFGAGADGAVTISANTTLTRDMNYSSLTIDAGVTLFTGGFKILCTGTITNNGTIDNSGSTNTAAQTTTPGATGTLGGGAPGATVTTTAYSGTLPTSATLEGGSGGGNGSNQTPPFATNSGILLNGPSLSGGASGTASSISGYFAIGGAGAGAIYIACKTLNGSGTISAIGANGYTSYPSPNGSNYGSGGGGGVIAILTPNYNFTGTLDASGGTGDGPSSSFNGATGQVLLYT